MNTKRILLTVLFSLVLWQMPAGELKKTGQGGNILFAAMAEDGILQGQESPEQQTENNFYEFVKEISGGDMSSKMLVCTDFRNRIQAFGFICGLISPESALKEFYEREEYNSYLLELKYDEKNVGNGFAKLTLNFKERKERPSYIIIFSSDKMLFEKK